MMMEDGREVRVSGRKFVLEEKGTRKVGECIFVT